MLIFKRPWLPVWSSVTVVSTSGGLDVGGGLLAWGVLGAPVSKVISTDLEGKGNG